MLSVISRIYEGTAPIMKHFYFIYYVAYLRPILHSHLCQVGCPRMTQLLKCYAPDAFSGAKFQVFLENGHEIDVG